MCGKEDMCQGCTPSKTRRTSLDRTPREAAVALAKLTQCPQELEYPIRHIDFASLVLPAGHAALRANGWLPGGRLPLRPELQPYVSELPCVRVGMPIIVRQLSVVQMLRMLFVHALNR